MQDVEWKLSPNIFYSGTAIFCVFLALPLSLGILLNGWNLTSYKIQYPLVIPI